MFIQDKLFGHLILRLDEILAKEDRLLQWVEEQLSPRQRTIEWQTYQSLLIQRAHLQELTTQYCEMVSMFERITGNELFHKNLDIRLVSEHHLALDSNDYLYPESTTEGCMRHPRLCQKAETLFGHNINFLDVGCGGAALVFDFAVRGHLGIGLDGSDQCRKNGTGYWPLLPKNLFTCDITKPFVLTNNIDNVAKFHLITMWEVLEHIAEQNLNAVLQNIKKHLAQDGFFIGSISRLEYFNPTTGIIYHQTVREPEFWSAKFAENGLVFLKEHPFDFLDFYRGIGPAYQDEHNYYTNPEAGFHFVAQRTV